MVWRKDSPHYVLLKLKVLSRIRCCCWWYYLRDFLRLSAFFPKCSHFKFFYTLLTKKLIRRSSCILKIIIGEQPLVLHNFVHLNSSHPVFIEHTSNQLDCTFRKRDTALGKLDWFRNYVILNSFQIINFGIERNFSYQ